jgi:hypothetical protein
MKFDFEQNCEFVQSCVISAADVGSYVLEEINI